MSSPTHKKAQKLFFSVKKHDTYMKHIFIYS